MSNTINIHKVAGIKGAIEHYIHPNNNRSDIIRIYRNWYIGITNNTGIRKAQHIREKKTKALYFHFWDAGNKETAIEIEKYFHTKGMKDKDSVGGAKSTSSYVYIFKISTTIADDLAHLFGIIK